MNVEDQKSHDLTSGDGTEEGEIVSESREEGCHDEDSDYIPLAGGADRDDGENSEEDDDEAPEEILNRIAKEKAAVKEEEVIDPALCRICKKNPHKYRCPKCDVRTCSLDCSKVHKADNSCDGVRPPFDPVGKLSQYDGNKSVRDQNWMHSIQNKVYQEPPQVAAPRQQSRPENGVLEEGQEDSFGQNSGPNDNPENRETEGGEPSGEQQPRQFPQYINEDGTRNSANSAVERFLLPNAHRRRIWLSFSEEKDGTTDCSRHEQFSDSIFWCIDFIFTKKLEDGSLSEYSYRVQNIPETIRICTVLKQFLKPRKYGCIVSECDLDMEKMKPFIDAGLEKVSLFMRVPRFEKERYYVINPEKHMLDNTRNRVILDHPKIIVVIADECPNFQPMSEDEAEDLRGRLQKERYSQQGQNRGRGGMSRGFRGGGFRGAPRGGFGGGDGGFGGGRGRGSFRGGFKRPFNGPPGGDSDWKRGRGGGGRGGRGGFRGGNRHHVDLDTFDPFEPFQGKQRLPLDYGKDVKKEPADEVVSWANALVSRSTDKFESSTSEAYVAPVLNP